MPTVHILPTIMHPWFTLLAIAVTEGTIVYTWHFREEPGALALIYLQICRGVWIGILLLAGLSTEHGITLCLVSVFKTANLLSTLFWFRFITQLSESDHVLPAWLLDSIYGTMSVLSVLMLTNAWHGWCLRLVWMPGNTVQLTDGPAYAVFVCGGLAVYLLAIWLCLRWVFGSVGLRRRQASLLLLAGLLSLAGQVMVGHPVSAVREWMPLCILLSNLFLVWVYYRWCLLRVKPLAQQLAVEKMIDGLMVVDEAGYIAEVNPAAIALFADLFPVKGHRFQEAIDAWPELARLDEAEGGFAMEANRNVAGLIRDFRITLTLLQTQARYYLGRIVVFKDITVEKQQQACIVEQERALALLTERERLGRELHDGPSQLWSFLAMQVHAVRLLIERQRYELAVRALDQLQHTVQEAHLELRESIAGLQTDVSGELGLITALEKQLEWYRENCDLHAELIVRCSWRQGMLSPQVEAQALRILQEALSNVRKSARANRIQLRIESEDHRLTFLVEDDGCGFDPLQVAQRIGHHGLHIMRQRAEEIDAQLAIDSQPGNGTRILLCVPLAANENEEATVEGISGREGER
jgi:signal transduction histidine kinase